MITRQVQKIQFCYLTVLQLLTLYRCCASSLSQKVYICYIFAIPERNRVVDREVLAHNWKNSTTYTGLSQVLESLINVITHLMAGSVILVIKYPWNIVFTKDNKKIPAPEIRS